VTLWIIYKEGIVISKIVAEMLHDRLEDYIDVSVGNANKIDPAYLVEERLEYLIIGDTISETIPSLEIQNWLLKFGEISKYNNLRVKALSGFYITLADIKVEPSWLEFLQENINFEIIYPPILHLNLNRTELITENEAFEIVKDYSNDFIEFFIN